MAIQFTQWMRPYGVPERVEVDRPAAIESLAQSLLAAGCQLDCEVLATGEVSFTVEHENWPGTVIASEIVVNGPTVLPAVDRLIQEAHCLWTGEQKTGAIVQ